MERDPTAIVFSLGILILAAVAIALIGMAVRRRRESAENPAIRRERDIARKRSLDAGTHVALADGSIVPTCEVAGCKIPAKCRPLKFAREEGLGDFVRRLFGAPPRLRVVEDVWGEPVRCESHQFLAREEMRLKLSDVERRRQEHQRDGEVELGHFERTLKDRVCLVVEKHERQLGGRKRRISRDGNVLPFSSRPSSGTGTGG
jgi:hypothetical protein